MRVCVRVGECVMRDACCSRVSGSLRYRRLGNFHIENNSHFNFIFHRSTVAHTCIHILIFRTFNFVTPHTNEVYILTVKVF